MILAFLFAQAVFAADTLKFNFKDADITKVIEEYASASKQRFIIDPQVKGKITILNPSPISVEEAFNQLSTALANNGVSYVIQDGVVNVKQSRNIQRDSIPVVTELPPMRPERMVTWIIKLKYASAEDVNRQLRILCSRDGELVPYLPTNSLIVSDFTPNLHRIGEMLKTLDQPRAK